MTSANHHQLRSGQRRAWGEPSLGASAAQAAVGNKFQLTESKAVGRGPRSLHAGRGLFIRTAGGGCIRRQRRRALRLLPGRPATFNLCAPLSRALALKQNVCRQTADLLERHSISLRRYVQQLSETTDGTVLYPRGNFPDQEGARQHDCG